MTARSSPLLRALLSALQVRVSFWCAAASNSNSLFTPSEQPAATTQLTVRFPFWGAVAELMCTYTDIECGLISVCTAAQWTVADQVAVSMLIRPHSLWVHAYLLTDAAAS